MDNVLCIKTVIQSVILIALLSSCNSYKRTNANMDKHVGDFKKDSIIVNSSSNDFYTRIKLDSLDDFFN
jgi:hypothetical protein